MTSVSIKAAFAVAAMASMSACGGDVRSDYDAFNSVSTRLNVDNDLSSLTRVAIAPTQEQSMNAYLTGYSWWDNTPRGSAQIARPVIHRTAGGVGTYKDPITLAVGHRKTGGRSIMDYKPGTRFYIENLKKYAIVEDMCGDGPRPQEGPCHTGHRGHDWIDIYVGGRRMDEASVDACMRRITGIQSVILNPRPGYPVVPGEIASTGCRTF